jgi:hypothetical protein
LDLNRPAEVAEFIFDYAARGKPIPGTANGTSDGNS